MCTSPASAVRARATQPAVGTVAVAFPFNATPVLGIPGPNCALPKRCRSSADREDAYAFGFPAAAELSWAIDIP
ncbi:hypothetical protein HEK616_81490 (plasmid) [Streptomyces nigrescens]|uniref:Uncharacterized protein n=1 Tax=Streptomyces nigrescens TaxID=1920 RepID=A0ABM8A7D5_STRNI|nr:hypothetical protein HEK616_81490 [Streptomyces nigrescens]